MNIDIRENNIGIVVRGDFQSIKTTPRFLLSKGVITQDEYISQSDDCLVTPNEIKYNLGVMNVVCDPTRIQITSNDISLSGRLIRMVIDVLAIAGEVKLVSIGLNAGVLFSFNSFKDTMSFGQYFGMLDNLKPFMADPRLRTVVYEDSIKANAETPKVTIKLAALETITVNIPQTDGQVKTEGGIPLCTLDINNHFAVCNIDEAIPLIQKAEFYHSGFREKYHQVFKAI